MYLEFRHASTWLTDNRTRSRHEYPARLYRIAEPGNIFLKGAGLNLPPNSRHHRFDAL
jgi:hypothetical protein